MKYCIVALIVSISITAYSQTNSWRFDFGNGPIDMEARQVKATTFYNEQSGYGFEPGSELIDSNRFVTSKLPFFFSVKLPEGNYKVMVTVGGPAGISITSIRAECRRLMVQEVQTKKGKFATVSFMVHVKDSLIHGTDRKVRLKPREINYLHWDNKLTLEFNDAQPKIQSLQIVPATDVTTVFLAGNSTVVDQAEEPYAAWGQMLPAFFQPEKVVIANYAESGEALNSFMSARRLEKVLSLMKPGDYLFIEFGHNDQKAERRGSRAFYHVQTRPETLHQ
jgi:hypothetical protein